MWRGRRVTEYGRFWYHPNRDRLAPKHFGRARPVHSLCLIGKSRRRRAQGRPPHHTAPIPAHIANATATTLREWLRWVLFPPPASVHSTLRRRPTSYAAPSVFEHGGTPGAAVQYPGEEGVSSVLDSVYASSLGHFALRRSIVLCACSHFNSAFNTFHAEIRPAWTHPVKPRSVAKSGAARSTGVSSATISPSPGSSPGDVCSEVPSSHG